MEWRSLTGNHKAKTQKNMGALGQDPPPKKLLDFELIEQKHKLIEMFWGESGLGYDSFGRL